MRKHHPWQRVSIKDVCESIIDCVNKTAPVVEGPTDYRMIRTTNVRDGWIDMREAKYVTEAVYRRWTRRSVPRRGDVILTREAPLGEVGMLRSDEPVFLGQRLVQYRADPRKIDNRFLLYSFVERDLQAQIKALGSGATVEHMRVPDAEKLTVLLPALSTQRKIGAVLGAYDDLIENNHRRIKILEEMARMVYREWFVEFRFPGHAKVKLVESRLGRIPQGWELRDLKEVARVTYGFPFDSKRFNTTGKGEPIIRIRDILNGRSQTFTDEEVESKYRVSNGDILVGMDGDFHMCIWAAGQALQNQRVARFESSGEIGSYHLFLALERPIKELNQAIVGTTVAHLGDMHIKAIKLVWPPSGLLATAREMLEPISEEIIVSKRQLSNLRETRDLLVPKLISGGVSVKGLKIETVVGEVAEKVNAIKYA